MFRVVEARLGSIVDAGVTCVVNASNEYAVLGGGVSRALFEECGGEVLQSEMSESIKKIFDGVLDEGDCLVTSAGTSTKFRHILHVPSVDYRNVVASSAARVRECTYAALAAAATLAKRESEVFGVAFPLLAAGSGGLSPEVSIRAMIAGLRDFFSGDQEAPLDPILFMLSEEKLYRLCQRALSSSFA